MPFDNFYEKSDKEKVRHWKSVISTFALLAVVFISISGLYGICSDYIDDYQKKSARIKHVDELCQSLPKPELFNFIKRENPVSYNNNAAEIIYHYQTDRDSKVIIQQFLEWFNSNGWKRDPIKNLTFTKGEQRINIRSTDNYFKNYDIDCYQEDISFGVYD